MSDLANLNRNFLRGAQRTDADGVAQFQTLFPGHYDGRAPHIHVITRTSNPGSFMPPSPFQVSREQRQLPNLQLFAPNLLPNTLSLPPNHEQ